MYRPVVLGAGASGLSAARALRRAGAEPIVLEAAQRPGGTLSTHREAGYTVELGPNTVQDSPALRRLLEDCGAADRLVEASAQAKRRYLVRDGGLVALPGSPPAVLSTPLLSPFAKLRLAAEPFIGRGKDPEETVAAFVERRCGPAALPLADAMTLGVYAGNPEELLAARAFPKLNALETEHGSLLRGAFARRHLPRPALVAFEGGFEAFAEALARDLDLRLGARVERVEAGDGFVVQWSRDGVDEVIVTRELICALPAVVAAEVLAGLGGGNPWVIPPHAPVAVVALGYPRERIAHPLDGFGFLVPHAEKRRVLGCLFSSTLFPDRAPPGRALLTAMVGGRRRGELVDLDDKTLVDLAREELGELLEITGEPDLALVRRWRPGIPQATAAMNALDRQAGRLEEDHPGLVLLGNWRRGVGVPDCLAAGESAPQQLGFPAE